MAKTEAQLKKWEAELKELSETIEKTEKAQAALAAELDATEAAFAEKIKTLDEREGELVEREVDLQDKEAKLAKQIKKQTDTGVEVKVEEKPEPTPAEKKLIAAGCKAFGIAQKHVLSSKVYDGKEVVIVTHGGAKVRFKDGDEVEPLDPIRVDGVIRKKMKPVTGGKKK